MKQTSPTISPFARLKPPSAPLIAALALSSTFAFSFPVTAQIQSMAKEYAPISQRKLNTNPSVGRYERLLGLTPYGTAIIVSSTEITSDQGEIETWSVRSRKVSNRTPLTKWIDNYDLKLSFDGRLLVSNANRISIEFPDVRSYRITLINTQNLKQTGNFDLKSDEDTSGHLFIPGDDQHLILKMQTVIPFRDEENNEDDAYFGKDRFVWLNLATGKYDKVLSYSHGRGADKILYSPDKKYLSCLFSDMRFDLIDKEVDRFSIIDILDSKTGKILWHIQGSKNNPAGEPLFFISPTQFISSDTMFDIKTKTATPWKAVRGTQGCIAAVPNHPQHALFLTKQGVELRNWKSQRVLRRWPTLKKRGRVFFAPNLDMFAYKTGEVVQFWDFSRTWLK